MYLIWDKKHECMKESDLRQLQFERLSKLVKRLAKNVPHYNRAFAEAGVKPKDITRLEDIARLPFTTKEHIADSYPFGLFAAPMDKIIRLHSSSGTTGKPKVAGYTKNDIRMWSEMMARSFYRAGVTEKDMVQNAYGYGLFTGGLGAHYGGEAISATVVPVSGGNTKRQIMIMCDFQTTVLCSTPSYALFLAEVAREEGLLDRIALRVGIFGAEFWSEKMRAQIERNLRISAIDIYGLTEIVGPGVASECECKNGLHISDDHFYPEIIDPDTGEVLPEGERGELVITTLTKEGFPLLRYRTRDITSLKYGKCECGRTSVRMDRVTGRSDDMLIVRGVNVYPSQIESIIVGAEGVEPHYVIIVDREHSMDTLEIWIEVSENIFTDEIKGLEKINARLKHQIESTIGISARIKLVEPKSIARSEGKAKRIIDKREI